MLIPLGVVIGLILSPLLDPLPVTTQNPNTLYLLSAIAQSLAAILALVFTISLVIAQLSSRYSHRMLASFFNIPTTLYILFFIAAVFLPFWLLNYKDPDPWAVKLSLILASAALLLLVPYFLSFKYRLNPETMVGDLKKKAIRQLRIPSTDEPKEIRIIDNTVMSAFIQKDYDTFESGVGALAELIREAYNLNRQDIRQIIQVRLHEIGLVILEDPRAINLVMEKITQATAGFFEEAQ